MEPSRDCGRGGGWARTWMFCSFRKITVTLALWALGFCQCTLLSVQITKPVAQRACWVFSRFRNPPNSDNTWTTGSLTCVHHYMIILNLMHTWGLGTLTLTASQHNIFDSGPQILSPTIFASTPSQIIIYI